MRRTRPTAAAATPQTPPVAFEATVSFPLAPVLSSRRLLLPLALSRVQAGFPSPAEDYIEARLDLNELLIRRPAATFFLRVRGDSMTGAGIRDGDLLVVDRAAEPRDGGVVVAAIDGHLTVRTLRRPAGGGLRLEAASDGYPPLCFGEGGDDAEVCVWGVVTAVIHQT